MKRSNGSTAPSGTLENEKASSSRVAIDDGNATTSNRRGSAPQKLAYSNPNGAEYHSYLNGAHPNKHHPDETMDDDEEDDSGLFPGEHGGPIKLRVRPRSSSSDDAALYKSTSPMSTRKRKSKRKSKPKGSFWKRFYNRWIKGVAVSFGSLFIAVLLWYFLGVVSIATSKLLLSEQGSQTRHHRKHHPLIGGVPPLFLTLQQLCIGALLLRFLLQIRFMNSPGVAPWPIPSQMPPHHRRSSLQRSQSFLSTIYNFLSTLHPQLAGAGFFFALGFLMTNYGFAGSSASFVETVKAAEPITSASVAVWSGIESLSKEETASLLAIVFGVALSTMGHSSGDDHAGSNTHHKHGVSESVVACVIVMVANLSFSCRGLYQKLFRALPEGNTQVVDDLNLQLRMQQIGIALLIVPVLVWEASLIVGNVGSLHRAHGLWSSGVTSHYLLLSLLNGFAFTSYNLASTYILSRISVVHHAALNSVRRVFAIIVTSIYFVVPVTFLGSLGILVSFGGFMSFTHYKVQRQRKPKPLSSLLPVSVGNG